MTLTPRPTAHPAPPFHGFLALGSGPTASLLPLERSPLKLCGNLRAAQARHLGPHSFPQQPQYGKNYEDEHAIVSFPHSMLPLASGLNISLMTMATQSKEGGCHKLSIFPIFKKQKRKLAN